MSVDDDGGRRARAREETASSFDDARRDIAREGLGFSVVAATGDARVRGDDAGFERARTLDGSASTPREKDDANVNAEPSKVRARPRHRVRQTRREWKECERFRAMAPLRRVASRAGIHRTTERAFARARTAWSRRSVPETFARSRARAFACDAASDRLRAVERALTNGGKSARMSDAVASVLVLWPMSYVRLWALPSGSNY